MRATSVAWAWLVCATVHLISSVPLLNLYARGVLGAFLVWFVACAVLARRPVHGQAPITGFLVWSVFALAVSLQSVDVQLALQRWVTVFLVGMLALATLNAIVWSGSARHWCHAYIATAILAYLSNYAPIEQYLTVDYETEQLGRYAGTLGNANAFGRAMTQAYFVGLALLVVRVRSRHAMVVILSMGVLGLAAIESSSRTALLGLGVGVVSLFLCARIRTLVTPLNFAALWGVAAAIVVVFLYLPGKFDSAISRMKVFFSFLGLTPEVATGERSIDHRLELARLAIEVTAQNPLGVGLNNFSLYVGTYSHSNFLEVLVSSGVVGLPIYLAGFAVLAARCVMRIRAREASRWSWFMIWALGAIAVMDLFSISYYSKSYWVFIAILCGMGILEAGRGPRHSRFRSSTRRTDG